MGFVSSSKLIISPSEINFNITQNQKSCEQITIQVDKQSTLIGQDRWAEKGIAQRKFTIHTLSSKDLDLELNYPQKFETNGVSIINVCITAKDSGFYHGLLLYKIENNNAGVGVWLNVNVSNSEKFSIKKITGNVINSQNNYSKIFLSMLIFYSTIILVLLLIKINKRKIKSV